MFHRKHSAGTKQKDKFRHRKAIHRIVSRPHNLKFPGGHDAFTNYFDPLAELSQCILDSSNGSIINVI